ncbi:hypothetical protein [Bacillus sp. FJAT-45066]|uniref:hypothetical protein n=1 Tax=Bacillus sp. FJAT-45066 TaxID=2011010 RepID=UPI000BB69566|nr:hypothetical protein [Bacillus sp. FJAT-45066]
MNENTSIDAHIPEDGGWTEENGKSILLLSIPSSKSYINKTVHKFSYKWVYDREEKAYVLIIEANNTNPFAIIFHEKHAGELLLDADAYGEFILYVTSELIEEIDENTSYLILPKIKLTRNVLAGW